MEKPHHRQIDALLSYDSSDKGALADLMRLSGEYQKLVACFLAEGAQPKFNISDFEIASISAAKSLDKIEVSERRELGRRFIQISVYALTCILGEDAHSLLQADRSSEDADRLTMIKWLEVLKPAVLATLSPAGGAGLTVDVVEQALSALNAGETPTLFRKGKRKGRELNAHSLALTRYKMLRLCDALLSAGTPRKEVDNLAHDVTSAERDTRRKWVKAIQKVVSKDDLKRADRELTLIDGVDSLDAEQIKDALATIGVEYRRIQRSK